MCYSAQPHFEVSKVTSCKGRKGFAACSPAEHGGSMRGGPVGLTMRRAPQPTVLRLVRSLMLEGLWWLTASVCAPQRTFGHLALSHRPYFVPKGFWQSFKDYDGEPTNVREHQDAYEFFTRLQV